MNFLRNFGKWILRILAAIAILVVAVLIIFRLASLWREQKTFTAAAPSSGHFVTVDGLQIYVQEVGPLQGQPVVFVHGFGAWSETWRKTMNVLGSNGFRSVAIDLPPFGFTQKVTDNKFSRQDQAKRIIGVLDALDLQSVVLVGHSVGARPTIEATLNHPERVKALVLVDPALGFGANDQFEQNNPSWLIKTVFAIRPLRNSLLALTATNPLMTKKLLSTFVADPGVLTPELLKVYQQPLVIKDSTNRLGDWLKTLIIDQDNSQSSDFTNFTKIKAPTFIIWGSKDTVTPLLQGVKLAQLIPGSSLSVLSGLGHIPQIEDPDKFNSSLLGFLQELK